MTQLADLIAIQSTQQIVAIGLGVYQGAGFPVQSWQVGGVERTRLLAFATAIADTSATYIPQIAGGTFLDYASLTWLQLTAAELYNLVYNAPSQTVGNITATAVSGAGPYSFNAGDLIAVFGASGRRYINTSAGTIASAASTVIQFGAEFVGTAYNDPSNSGAITLATPKPGVTLTNPALTFGLVVPTGAGTGTITPTGAAGVPNLFVVRIDVTGQAATTSWSYSISGSPFVSFGVGNATNLAGLLVNITLTDGASGTSFIQGQTFTFQTPGSWITSQGTDTETVTALAQRCRNRWASLSAIPTNSLYQLLATSAPGIGGQVTQCVVFPDSVVSGQVNIVVAGPAGVLPSATIAALQAYISPRVPLTEKPFVLSPSTLAITIGGIVTATAAQLAAAQGLIQVALTNYFAGLGINGTVRRAAIVRLIMEVAGVVDAFSVTINGAAVDDLVLGNSTTFVLPSLQPLALSYVGA